MQRNITIQSEYINWNPLTRIIIGKCIHVREMRISVCQCQYQYQLADAKRTRCIVNYPVNYDRPN